MQSARRAVADIPDAPVAVRSGDPGGDGGGDDGDDGDSGDGGDGGGGDARAANGSYLGRRCMSVHEGRFYPATVFQYAPAATKWRYLVHWDDGVTHRWDGEQDTNGPKGQSSVQLLSERVQTCKCARYILADPNGCAVATGRIAANA